MASSDLPTAASAPARRQVPIGTSALNSSETSAGNLRIKFWGVRGSYPVPGPDTVKYGGNTACVEVRNSCHRLILDAGTGLIALGNSIMAEYGELFSSPGEEHSGNLALTILLSHTHYDHVQGLPFFMPAYSNKTELYLFGPQLLGVGIRDNLSQIMVERNFPVTLDELGARKSISDLDESLQLRFGRDCQTPHVQSTTAPQPVQSADDLGVEFLRSAAHPKGGVYVFRISYRQKRLVYATDVEGDPRLIDFARNADVLIHDAQYTAAEYTNAERPKQGFGHSTIEMACKAAQAANVKQLILFHHDPQHTDQDLDRMENHARSLFQGARAAREDMEIEITS